MGHENERPKKCRRHLPPGTGEFSVGCVDVMSGYTDKGSFFRLYYPVEKTDIFKRHTQWPLWLPRKQYGIGYSHFLKRNTTIFGKLFNWLGGDVYVPALWQAPLCESRDNYPVIVFSHGIGGNRTTYTTFCCDLASHGFIVAAVEHRDGSASATYHFKDRIRKSASFDDTKNAATTIHRSDCFKEEWKFFEHTEPLGISLDDFQYRNKQVHHRAEECIRLADLLTSINEGNGVDNFFGFHFNLKQFKGKLDLSRLGFIGHSFGGSTCVCTLSKDRRFKVGILLDSWMHPLEAEVYERVQQPLLMINYETFQWKKNVQQMKQLETADTDRIMITVKGTCHQSCTDFQFLFTKPVAKFLDLRYILSPKKALHVNTKASLSFLWKHMDINTTQTYEDLLDGSHDLVIPGSNIDVSS